VPPAREEGGGDELVVLRRPAYLLGLMAAIVSFGVLSSTVGEGALPAGSVPAFGVTNNDWSLSSVAELGDVNGDHIADYAVGLPSADTGGSADAGIVYVFLGHAGALPPTPTALNLSAASFTISGHAGEMLGFSIAGLDMNHDGLNDIAIGAPMAGAPGKSGAGAVYVIFGSHAPGNVATASLYADGRLTNDPVSPAPASPIGSRYDGIVQDSHTGYSVAALGDVNDGVNGGVAGGADLAVGAPDGDLHIPGGGGLIVLYGTAQGVHITLNDLWDKGYPYWYHADFPSQDVNEEHTGQSVAVVGDVTGDGYPDIAVGAPQADFNGRANSGSVWIVSGHIPQRDAGCTAMLVDNSCPWIRLWQMNAAQATRIDGAQAGDGLGSSIAGIGDQNGDGIPDIAIGESGASPAGRAGAGAVVVVPGQRHVAERDLAASPPLQRIYGAQAGAGLGASLAAAGDIDGDGHGDMLIGSPGESSSAGAAYVVRGLNGATSDLANPSARISLGAGSQTGSSVAAGQALDGGDLDSLLAAPGVGAFIVGGTGTPVLPSGNAPPPPPPAQPAAPAAGPLGTTPTTPKQPAKKVAKKKLPLCPLKKPKAKYHTRQGQAREGEGQALQAHDGEAEGQGQGAREGKGEGQGQGEGEGEGQSEGRGQVARPAGRAA